VHPDTVEPTADAPAPGPADLEELTAAVARLEGTADALDARLERRPCAAPGGGQESPRA
jgi:hypothetical protein